MAPSLLDTFFFGGLTKFLRGRKTLPGVFERRLPIGGGGAVHAASGYKLHQDWTLRLIAPLAAIAPLYENCGVMYCKRGM